MLWSDRWGVWGGGVACGVLVRREGGAGVFFFACERIHVFYYLRYGTEELSGAVTCM